MCKKLLVIFLCVVYIFSLTACFEKYIECTKCKGKGSYECLNCDVSKEMFSTKRCVYCNGMTYFKCNLCNGKGKITEDMLPKVKYN